MESKGSFEGVESRSIVETVLKGAAVMQEVQPDWIVAMGGGSPIDAAKSNVGISMNLRMLTFERSHVFRSISRN